MFTAGGLKFGWSFATPGPPKTGADRTNLALDQFYATDENLGVPIVRAIQILAAKEAGLDEAAIRKKTEEFRREARTYDKWEASNHDK